MVSTHSMPVPTPAQDPISHEFAQISADGEYVRRLTVSYGARRIREPDGRSTSAPFLRLQGAWLKRARFDIGAAGPAAGLSDRDSHFRQHPQGIQHAAQPTVP